MKILLTDGPAAGREITAVKTHVFVLVQLDGRELRYRLMGVSAGVLNYSWDGEDKERDAFFGRELKRAAQRGEKIPTFSIASEKTAGTPEPARA